MEIILLVLAISLDSFVVSIHYGVKKIRIPFKSIIIINMICSFVLGTSIFLGNEAQKLFPSHLTSIISFLILLFLGIYYLFEGLIKLYLESKSSNEGKLEIRFAGIKFIINLYLDGTKADKDKSNVLDSKEAIYLAMALSVDSLTLGFGSGLSNMDYLCVMFCSFMAGFISILGGLSIGNKLSNSIDFNLSWVSGILIIILAIMRLF